MMGSLLLLLAAVMALVAIHPFTTYPLSLVLLARRHRRAVPQFTRDDPVATPEVALCVCAYNEEKVIRAKVENMIAMRQAIPALRLLVYVDCASDQTAAILSEFADQIDITVSPSRLGKTHGMNTLVAKSEADIVVFSDANVMFAPDAIVNLLRPFTDPAVGCVCGHLIYVTSQASTTAVVGSVYWRLEERIKELESATGSTMGADGSIFAIRRALHRPPPPDIIDDMFVSLSILCAGYRIVRAADAMAYEETASQSGDEFRRKIRISCQAYNVNRLLWPKLRRLPPLERYKYVSHKLLRWFCVYALGAAALFYIAGLVVFQAWWVLAASALAAVLGIAGALLAPASPFGKMLDVLSAIFATGLGIVQSFRGKRFQVWTPPASAREINASPIRPKT